MKVIVVDGYNVIGARDDLIRLKRRDIGEARHQLIEMLSEYKAYTGDRIIVVFDALYVKGTEQKTAKFDIEIIFTKEDETADECIERLVKSLKNVKNQVYVATSDYLEQTTIFSRGALRMPARELFLDMDGVDDNIRRDIDSVNSQRPKNSISKDEQLYNQLSNLRDRLSK